jgi:cytochrome P450
MKVPPGPKGLPIIGNLEAFEEDRLGFILKCRRDYGDIVRYNSKSYIIYHPDDLEQVFSRTNKEFVIGFDVFQRGIDQDHTNAFMLYRQAITKGFRKSLINAFLPNIEMIVRNVASYWNQSPYINVLHEMEKITGSAIAMYSFGRDGKYIPKLATELLDALIKIIGNPILLPKWIPTITSFRINRAKTQLFNEIRRIVEDRLNTDRNEGDLISSLLNEGLLNDEAENDRVLQALSATILAAHRVPASAISWTIYLLSKNAEVERLVREEVSSIKSNFDLDVLAQCINLECVVKESLRLYPPTWLMDRQVNEDCEIGGYSISKGQEILFSPYAVHRDSRFYQEPEVFQPNRWVSQNFENKRPKYSYIPFGGGQESV